ncbi:MAG: DUF4339 domain-containing protein [Puniceicoccales bacterium]|jgi:hypothetical protein|nr:DUF4339 domain-containing protein [Puniceicoccales bacterium]
MKLGNYEVTILEGREENGVVALRDGSPYSLHFLNNAPNRVKVGLTINGKQLGYYNLTPGFNGTLDRAAGSDQPFTFSRNSAGTVVVTFYADDAPPVTATFHLVELKEQSVSAKPPSPTINAASAPVTFPVAPPAPHAPAAGNNSAADILVAHDDSELGPLSEAQVVSKLRSGELARSDTYWRDGMDDWEPLGNALFVKNAKGLPPPRNAPPPRRKAAKGENSALAGANDVLKKTWQVSNMFGLMIEKLLHGVAKLLTPERIEGILNFMRKAGQYGIIVTTIIAILCSVVLSIVTNRTAWLLLPIPIIIFSALGQFFANRFLDANEKIITGTRNRLSSTVVLECVALFSLLLAVCAIESIVGALFFLIVAAIALHPKVLNIEQQDNASVSEEALSLWMFSQKLGLKMTPFIFALSTVASAICCILGTLMLCGGKKENAIDGAANIFTQMGLFGIGVLILFIGCLLPAISYFSFLFWGFFSDFVQSIVVVPSKLDKLKESLTERVKTN